MRGRRTEQIAKTTKNQSINQCRSVGRIHRFGERIFYPRPIFSETSPNKARCLFFRSNIVTSHRIVLRTDLLASSPCRSRDISPMRWSVPAIVDRWTILWCDRHRDPKRRRKTRSWTDPSLRSLPIVPRGACILNRRRGSSPPWCVYRIVSYRITVREGPLLIVSLSLSLVSLEEAWYLVCAMFFCWWILRLLLGVVYSVTPRSIFCRELFVSSLWETKKLFINEYQWTRTK